MSHINVLFTFRRLRMYQVNINLHSQVPNTKTAFLAAPPSSSHHFLPNLRQPNPPPHRLWPPSAWSETAADFLFFPLLLFLFSCSFSGFNFFNYSKKHKPQQNIRDTHVPATFIELIVWPAYLRHIIAVTSSTLLFCLPKSGSLRQIHLAIWDKYV